jgi:hypothetical protein
MPGTNVAGWLFVSSSGILGVVPWVQRVKWRFSIRALLIATTFVAVVLALVVFLK